MKKEETEMVLACLEEGCGVFWIKDATDMQLIDVTQEDTEDRLRWRRKII